MRKWFVADFETTSEAFYQRYGYTKVWLYSICDSNAVIVNDGDSIESFIDYVRRNLCGKAIYFHNLKFDGSFIIDYLMRQGYQYYDSLTHADKGLSCLIGDSGEVYNIQVKFSSKRMVTFYDSLKLLPFKVSKIAKDFNLPILKEVIDYEDYTIDARRLEYVHHDVQIVAMALTQIKAEGMLKNTTASCAYSQYQDMKDESFLAYNYPDLSTDFLTTWRSAYRGGRSQVNPLYAGKTVHDVHRYDVNSMYPYVMHDLPLPYGYPIALKSYEDSRAYRFSLLHVRIGFALKPHCLPSLLKKQALYSNADTYYVNSEDVIELYISNIDLDLLYRNYDCYGFEFLDGWGFATSTVLMRDYVDLWYSRKKVDKGAKRVVDKLMLNSLYGKFGSNVLMAKKYPVLEDGEISYSLTDEEEGKHYYLPLAIAIVSHAHRIIDDAIHSTGIRNFVYCDTDSVHTLGTLSPDLVNQTELGKFKCEAIEDTAKYVRQKCYITHEDNTYKVTCAGMPDNVKQRYLEEHKGREIADFRVGLEVKGKKLPKRVKGGTILHEVTFNIR